MGNKINFTGSYEQRALIAYTRSDGHENAIKVCKFFKKKYQERLYLVLTNVVRGILATYRIQNDGSLRRIILTPKQQFFVTCQIGRWRPFCGLNVALRLMDEESGA